MKRSKAKKNEKYFQKLPETSPASPATPALEFERAGGVVNGVVKYSRGSRGLQEMFRVVSGNLSTPMKTMKRRERRRAMGKVELPYDKAVRTAQKLRDELGAAKALDRVTMVLLDEVAAQRDAATARADRAEAALGDWLAYDNHLHNNPGHECPVACVERASLWGKARVKAIAALRSSASPAAATDTEGAG